MSSPMQTDSKNYLPPYLLGASTTPSSRPSASRPTPGRTPVASALSSNVSSDIRGRAQLQKPDKPGGPPVEGLYDKPAPVSVKSSTPLYMGRSPERRQLNFSQIRSSSRPGTAAAVTPSMGTLHNTPIASMAPDTMVPMSTQRTPPSPAQMDPFYTQGENLTSDDRYDEHCVTVFGFPKEASAFILEQFSQYGTVLRHVIADGNYMHICYQSKLQARTALSKNGKVFGGTIMIGVKPCIDKAVLSSFAQHEVPGAPEPISPVKPSGMRPLTAAYQASNSVHEVKPMAANTPQRSTGIIAKAAEYLFGW